MTLPLSLRLARRELRGGLKGFRIFLLCLMLGAAAIAAVGSLSAALTAGLNADARRLLGGDVELRLTHRPATQDQRTFLAEAGELSQTVEMRAMARAADGERSLVELKAVDRSYPLYGAMDLTPAQPLAAAVARDGGEWGAAADPALLRRLGIAVGDRLRVGEVDYVVRAAIEREPDRGADAFVLGPRLMVAAASLAETGLVREGSLIRYVYRLRLPDGADLERFLAALRADFPDAAWRVRDVRNGAPGLRSFIERMRLFLTLVGLTALLVGGLGIANAVKSYLESQTSTIAMLKCLGAPSGLVFRIYLSQVMILALAGVAAGVALGAAAPALLSGLLAAYLPFEARTGLYSWPLALAAIYGLLTALAFALWPLARAREVAAGSLFRDVAAPARVWPRRRYIVAVAACFAMLAAVAVLTAEDRSFAAWFVLGAAGSMLVFAAAARGVTSLAARLPAPRRPGLRLALANLHRPGAATVTVVLSFGLGLSVLVAVVMLEGNLSRQVADRLPEQAPAFFFLDIQPDQIAGFDRIAGSVPGVSEVAHVPMLRGRIIEVDGVASGEVKATSEGAWVLRGDRGLTYAAARPEDADVVAGDWWPADYSGPPLISFDAEVARGLGVGIGDTLTFNILGREIRATIANLREVDWSTLGINFVVIFAPGTLEGAPHSYLATAKAARQAELPLETAVTDAFPNVTAIRVRDALEAANRILGNIGVAVRSMASVTLVAGVLVLAGAIAAGHRRRVYEAVIFKVLGATRGGIMRTYLVEYALLGLVTALLAALVGSAAAYVIVTEVMEASWIWLPGTVAATAALSVAVTMLVGLAGTWAALGQRPAPLLRNE